MICIQKKESLEWCRSDVPVAYDEAVSFMEKRSRAIRDEGAPECIWLLEHPPLYTAGTSAKPADLLDPKRFPVYQSGRGGQYTYHGPGQRVAYLMLDLKRRGPDVRQFVQDIEEWLIRTLAHFGVKGELRGGRVGIWVDRGMGREDKIAAIGVRLRRWVSLHGISLNVAPNLGHFGGIVPCGIQGHGVTSLKELGRDASLEEVDRALMAEFEAVFEEHLRLSA